MTTKQERAATRRHQAAADRIACRRDFGERLAELLKSKEMTQTALAEAVGVGQATISLVLRGKRGMARPVVLRVAKALGVPPSALDGGPRKGAADHRNMVADAISDVPKTGLPPGDPEGVIRPRRDDAFEAFLVDEAADTSPREIDILRAISGRLNPSVKTSKAYWWGIREAIRARTWKE